MGKPKWTLAVKAEFSACHRLRGYQGKCEAHHGHNFEVEVTVEGDRLDERGMVMDFGDLKKMTREVVDELDHSDLNELAAFAEDNPSSENIARHIFSRLEEKLAGHPARLASVAVAERSIQRAIYSED